MTARRQIDAPFLAQLGLQTVLGMLDRGGHRGLIVGGAVRNAVLGLPVGDVDLATDAEPQRVIDLAHAAGLKSVPTGIDHGTVTVIADHTPYEITTFRRDVETFGRAATVAFSDRIEDDAERRDFTMNALYATARGEVLDPVGGWSDVVARRLRFVGDAASRIREDYLRILRFFRFYAWYATDFAPGTTEAIAANLGGLGHVSAERIGAEVAKLLAAPDPAASVALMAQTGVLAQVLPGADPAPLPALIAAEAAHDAAPDWLRRIALIAPADAASGLRLSRAQTAQLARLQQAAGKPLAEVAFRHGREIARDAALIAVAKGLPVPADWPDRIARAASASLPIAAADLMPGLRGPALGEGLRAAEALWLASDFTATRADLVAAARRIGESA